MPTKILIITQWFDPEPTFKGQVFARELKLKGFDVEVITGFPNYPSGKIYPGYKIKLFQKEILDGVLVTRVPLYPSHNSSVLGRIANYLSFSISATIYALFLTKRSDIIYAYHPPLTTGIAAIIIKFFKKSPLVYDIQDIWPDTLKSTGMINNKFILKIVGKICMWVYYYSDQIVVLSPGFKQLLIDRGVPKDKIHIIYDWCDEKSLLSPKGELHIDFPEKSKFKIIFAGNLGKAQALKTILNAAQITQLNYPLIHFVFVGDGLESKDLRQTAKTLELKNVTFIPSVPMEEVGVILDEADVLLIHLKKDPLFKITIPSKTQAYMAVGKPLIMAIEGDAASVVLDADCGLIAEPENAESIANAAIKLHELNMSRLLDMGKNSKNYYNQNFSLNVGTNKFKKLFLRIKK